MADTFAPSSTVPAMTSAPLLRIGLLGHGTVGSAFAHRVASTPELGWIISKIAVRDVVRHATSYPDFSSSIWSTDPDSVVSSPDVDVVVELIGGMEPARKLILGAIRAGKHVVTGNKMLLSVHGRDLLSAAHARGVDLRFEAAVCGAIPVVSALRTFPYGADVFSILGILNGTTNYIVSAMHGGSTFDAALRSAQDLGFAESDPSDDIQGVDPAAKLALLSSLLSGGWISRESTSVRGLIGVGVQEISAAEAFGGVVRLLARADFRGPEVLSEVTPTLLRPPHPLASLVGPRNGLLVDTSIGLLEWFGPGAGGPQTALSVASDVLSCSPSSPSLSRLASQPQIPSAPMPDSGTWVVACTTLRTLEDSSAFRQASSVGVAVQDLKKLDGGLYALMIDSTASGDLLRFLTLLAAHRGVVRVGPPLRVL